MKYIIFIITIVDNGVPTPGLADMRVAGIMMKSTLLSIIVAPSLRTSQGSEPCDCVLFIPTQLAQSSTLPWLQGASLMLSDLTQLLGCMC